jgi:phosphate-selective porin O/P
MTKSTASLLALAVTTSLALANGGEGDKKGEKSNPYQSGTASWKPGAGITLADTDEFGLKLSGQLQFQYNYVGGDTPAVATFSSGLLSGTDGGGPVGAFQTFSVRRARVDFSGNVWNRDINYKLKIETTEGISVKDAWAEWTFVKSDDNKVGLRVGQGKTGYGLESTGSSKYLYFVERASATRVFSDVRARGAWATGSHSENKIRWFAGIQNSEVAGGAFGVAEVGEEAPNIDNELNYVASVSFDPMGDMMGGKTNESFSQGAFGEEKDAKGTVGAGISFGNNRDPGNTTDIESTSFNVNTAWVFPGGISAQGEFFFRSDDPDGGTSEDSTGFYAQAGYTLPKSGDSALQWGFGLRYGMINTDNTSSFLGIPGLAGTPGDVSELTVGVDAFYHGHALKTQLDYTLQEVNPDVGADATNHIFRVQFTLLF